MDQHGHEFRLPGLDLTLCGVSVAGICTSLQIPEARLCVDCGILTPRGVRMRYLAVTHGHGDHTGALPRYLSTRHLFGMGQSVIFAPEAAVEGVRRLVSVCEELEKHPFETEVRAAPVGALLELSNQLLLRPFETAHTVPSCGYTLVRRRHVLRKEHQGRPGPEIARLRAQGVEISEERLDPLVTFTGDTVPEALAADGFAASAKVIVTELTFMGGEDAAMVGSRTGVQTARSGMHTHISELCAQLDHLSCDTLVVMHVSRKHSVAETRALLRTSLPPDWHDRLVLLHHEDRRI